MQSESPPHRWLPAVVVPSSHVKTPAAVHRTTHTPAVLPELPPDMEPPLPTEPPPAFDPSPVHSVGSVAELGGAARVKPVADGPADDLLTQAMGDQAVQTLLEVFPAEIKDVEEI